MRISCALLSMLNILSIGVTQSDIMPIGIPGGERDEHNCIISAGYSWCDLLLLVLDNDELPCSDNFSDCKDCLDRQRNGENIACPSGCDYTDGDPCSIGCPPMIPCPAPPSLPEQRCEYIPAPQDNCGCTVGCGTMRCSPFMPPSTPPPPPTVPPPSTPPSTPSISLEGEICGGYVPQSMIHICSPGLECVYTMGPMIADAPGTCLPECLTVRDEWGNCVDDNCQQWYDGCNTCDVDNNGLSKELVSCTEQVCFQNSYSAECMRTIDDDENDDDVNDIPNNCATWFDGCNTCSVTNGEVTICTMMYCYTQNDPYCMSITTEPLQENDICYRSLKTDLNHQLIV